MKICQNCGKPLTSSLKSAKWCSNSCRTVAWRKKHNVEPPSFLARKKRTYLNPEEERDVQRLQLESKSYETVVAPLEEEYGKYHTAMVLFETHTHPFPSKPAGDRTELIDGMILREVQSLTGLRKGSGENSSAWSRNLYHKIKRRVEELHKKIAEIEVELLARQRKIYKLIDRAAARDLVKKGPKKIEEKIGVSGSELANMKFDVLPFDDIWKDLIGEPSANFYGVVWGDAKSGKSYLALRFAQYLTRFGAVAYVATEEGISATMQKKIRDVKAYDVGVLDLKELPDIVKEIGTAKFVVIDSATKIELEPNDLSFLREAFPDTAFVVLLQSVKHGENFKGDQRWKHDCDFVIEVERPAMDTTRATCTGRFGNDSIEYTYGTPKAKKKGASVIEIGGRIGQRGDAT